MTKTQPEKHVALKLYVCHENRTSDRRGNHVTRRDDQTPTIIQRLSDVLCLLGREWQSFQWTDEHKDIFRNRLSENMSTFIEDISNLDSNICTQEYINEMTDDFTNHINSAAGNRFTINHKSITNPRFSQMSKARMDRTVWYDGECKAKKNNIKRKNMVL